MARITFVKRARTPNPVVSQEDIDHDKANKVNNRASYYWWKFAYGSKQYSKTQPRPSQLINSPFLSQIQAIQEMELDYTGDTHESLRDLREDMTSQIDELRDMAQESLDNMPESLQQGNTGQMLEQRVQSCEEWCDHLENVDLNDEDTAHDELLINLFEFEGDWG